ncbi:trafficking protein particle complex subunit 8 isoform 2-T2 [Aulostomus maculatus]
MAQCVQSVQEFVQDSFVPMVAVLCSEEADRVTRKNNLNFAELLRPFCRLTSEGHIRDPNNQVQVVKNLRICVNNVVTSPSAASAALSPAQRRLLNEVVFSCQPQEGAVASTITVGDYELSFSATTPWFEAYRENFLQSMPASDHEFLNHYLACLLVVSSTEAVPVEQFLKLSQEQHRIQHSGEYTNPKWFIPNTLKYYVLLHDMSEGEEQRAESVYEDMKQRYGPQGCYLLKMNSRSISAEEDEQIPDPWSQYLHRNELHSQDTADEAAPAVNSAAVENDVSAAPADGHHLSEKDGVSNSLENHPLQLDSVSSSGSLHTLSAVTADLKKGARDPESHGGAAGSHGACLTLTDHDHIRQFIQEFTFRGLLPHIEKNIRQLNDQLVSRKGLSRSLFTATKKWFGGGKVPEKSVSEPKSTSGLLYPPEAPELQIRKMADLCFLVQHYELAYSCYHTAKKDFLSDQATLYAAGALEMAAVSAFLQAGAPRPYPAHYMDTAIQTYRDVCKNMVLAERCALLSAEILKSQGKYSEAATLLIKMTSEDSDLRSALLLEQAAHCFINMRNRMLRKFAFHMILAGHRFSKAGQRRHALRCYCQAMQVYKGRAWSLAEDHINFTIGRQSFTLRQPENAVSAFKQILTNDSRQTATQQGAFLREYLYVYKSVLGGDEVDLPELPLPCIHTSATRIYFGHERRLAEGEKQAATHVSLDQEYDQDLAAMWCKLEEQLVAAANGGAMPGNFQPTQCYLNSQTDNLRHPLAVVEEPIIVELMLRNPLKVSLVLSHLSLLWRFSADAGSVSQDKTAGEVITNEEALAKGMAQKDDIVTTETILEFHMCSEETKVARLRLLPHRIGHLNIVGVVYNLAAASSGETASSTDGQQKLDLMVRGKQDLKIQGPRLNQNKEDKMIVRYGPDRRLDPVITPPMPLMEVFFLQFPTALLCGEIRKAYVEFCNVSSVSLCGLRVASTHPDFFTFGSQATTPLTPISPTSAENCSAYKTLATPPGALPGSVASETLVSAEDFSQMSGVMEIPIDGSSLQPGESTQLPLWLRGPDQEGVHEISFLFYYESTEKGVKISHRVVRHTVFICATHSLSVQASACRSSVPPHHSPEDKGSSGTLVFIDVENINTSEAGVREFHIIQVSSSSQHWRLHKCINLAKDKEYKLTSRERAKLCFRATRCKPQQAATAATKKYTFADLSLGNERIISSVTPCGDFFFRCCRPSVCQRAEVEAARTTSSGKSPSSAEDRTSDISNIVKKCNELDLNIIVIWKAYVVEDNKQLILEGQLHVALQTIDKEACSLTPKEEAQEMVLFKFKSELPPPAVLASAELSQLVKTNMHYPETYSHPFIQDSLCVVPVSLTLSNCSLTPVDVLIDLRHKNTSIPEVVEVHSSFTWVGQSRYKLQLKPEQVTCLTLRACFLQAGVYNLNTPRVFAKPAEQDAMSETSQQAASPALIIIKNA